MFEPNLELEKALMFSRFDESHPLSTCSAHPFQLEDHEWPTAEHYYQASKFGPHAYGLKVAQAVAAREAYKLGNAWFKRKRPDFKKVRLTLMTRALYCKARQNPEIAEFLLGTGEQKLAESSLYDPFWGVARDQRGANHLGRIWMDIRQKLRSADLNPSEVE